ncbi:MAG TPA: hypothetical protein VII69_09495 [Candidatus Eremiobacteraceae bacterium]
MLGRILVSAFVVAAAHIAGAASLGSSGQRAHYPAVEPAQVAQPDDTPSPGPTPSAELSPTPEVSSSPQEPEPTVVPSLAPFVPSPEPQPVVFATPSIIVQFGKLSAVHVDSPPSGILTLSGFDPQIIQAIFNSIDRSVDVTGLHTGSTTITATDQDGLSSTLLVRVQILAGRVADTANATITGNPAGPEFVAEAAIGAVRAVAYPEAGAKLSIDATAVTDAHTLASDDVALVHVPVTMTGDGMLTVQKKVAVTVTNIAQPRLPPRFLLVSDFPETLTENGTLFYADVNPDAPARLLYYHYAQKPETRRVIVKVQNNGVVASLVQLIAGVAGPDSNVLAAGHLATRRYLEREAANEGQIFEVPPHATLNVLDQAMPPETLITGVMQLRVVSGDGVRVALVAQDAGDSPVQPISDTLLRSAVRHARGVYSVPDFFYDETYTIGDPATVLTIGKLPLPNLVQGEVLGGDYGVKQSATVTLLNPGSTDARVGMWFEPRGGRATGTFFIDGQLLQIHAVDVGRDELLQSFIVPAGGYHQVSVTSMPEGGSSYPVNVIFSSTAPAAGSWTQSMLVY